MKNDLEVSVILLTYNPIKWKLMLTLESIVRQKNIKMEIIISDDASQEGFEKDICDYIKTKKIKYYYIKHDNNQGTVLNYYDAILKSNGKYTVVISPGDIFYNELSVYNLYHFANVNNVNICFGNAVAYNLNDGNLHIIKNFSRPQRPKVYDEKKTYELSKVSFFFGNPILGAGMLRSKKSALKYIGEATKCARYMEDAAANALAFLENDRIMHCNINTLWYEHGIGVSTSKNEKLLNVIKKESVSIYSYLKNKYPDNPFVDAAYFDRTCNNKFMSWIYRAFKHPCILCEIVKYKLLFPKHKVHITESEVQKLKDMIQCCGGKLV